MNNAIKKELVINMNNTVLYRTLGVHSRVRVIKQINTIIFKKCVTTNLAVLTLIYRILVWEELPSVIFMGKYI